MCLAVCGFCRRHCCWMWCILSICRVVWVYAICSGASLGIDRRLELGWSGNDGGRTPAGYTGERGYLGDALLGGSYRFMGDEMEVLHVGKTPGGKCFHMGVFFYRSVSCGLRVCACACVSLSAARDTLPCFAHDVCVRCHSVGITSASPPSYSFKAYSCRARWSGSDAFVHVAFCACRDRWMSSVLPSWLSVVTFKPSWNERWLYHFKLDCISVTNSGRK